MEPRAFLVILAEVYAEFGVATDQLPYTEEFESVYTEVTRRSGSPLTRAQLWRLLANERKRGRLARVRR